MGGLALEAPGPGETTHTRRVEFVCVPERKTEREGPKYMYTVDVRYRNREKQEEGGGGRAEQVGC